MNKFENKIIEVCSMCETASCWYGEFMCSESRYASTELETVRVLRSKGIENEGEWSDEKMISIYGEAAPFGYKDDDGAKLNKSMETT